MEEETSNILPSHILRRPTPSAVDNISSEDEKLHRMYGCELIQQAGTVLKLSQVVLITGQNILNRFFYRKSLKRFDVFSIAMGALLLASKVEESFKTLREVLFAFHFVYGKRKGLRLKPMELGGQQYTLWKNELLMMERYILKELGFSLYNIMDHPHKYILYFVKVLNGSEELANTSWGFLNDSMRLDISLRFEAQTIACAAIFLAARKIGVVLPEGSGDGQDGPWWETFSARTEDVLAVCDEILSIYSTPKVGWLEPIAEVEYLSAATCAQFDQIEEDEKDAVAVGNGDMGMSAENVQPSYACSTTSQVPFATSRVGSGPTGMRPAAADSTPPADAVMAGSKDSTPVATRGKVEEDKAAGNEADGPARKLERKWQSVVGDIDQLESAASTTGMVPALPPPGASASSRRDETDKTERDSQHRDSRRRDGSRDRRRPRSGEREERRSNDRQGAADRRRDSRERRREGDRERDHRGANEQHRGEAVRSRRSRSRDRSEGRGSSRRSRSRSRERSRRVDSRDRRDDRRRDRY